MKAEDGPNPESLRTPKRPNRSELVKTNSAVGRPNFVRRRKRGEEDRGRRISRAERCDRPRAPKSPGVRENQLEIKSVTTPLFRKSDEIANTHHEERENETASPASRIHQQQSAEEARSSGDYRSAAGDRSLSSEGMEAERSSSHARERALKPKQNPGRNGGGRGFFSSRAER